MAWDICKTYLSQGLNQSLTAFIIHAPATLSPAKHIHFYRGTGAFKHCLAMPHIFPNEMPVNFCLLKVDLPLHNLARWSRWLDFQMENRQHNGEFNIKLLSCHLTAQTSYFGLMECCQLPHTPLLSLENKELFFNGKDFFFKHDIPFLKAVFPVCNHFNVCILYMHSHIPPCYFYQGNISISILLMGLPFTFCFRWPYIWNKGSVNCHCQWCSPR